VVCCFNHQVDAVFGSIGLIRIRGNFLVLKCTIDGLVILVLWFIILVIFRWIPALKLLSSFCLLIPAGVVFAAST
jgi:hypothetical protein